MGSTCPNAHVGGAHEGFASVWYQVMFLAVDAETRAPRTSGTAIAMTCTQQSSVRPAPVPDILADQGVKKRALCSWLPGLHGNSAHNQANDIKHLSQLAWPCCARRWAA